MILLGLGVSAEKATMWLDPRKRERYATLLREALGGKSVSPDRLLEIAFKMLVVCEVYPQGRQWLHAFFRAIRGGRTTPISLATEPEVAKGMADFADVLESEEPIEVPLASRRAFPFAFASSQSSRSAACQAQPASSRSFSLMSAVGLCLQSISSEAKTYFTSGSDADTSGRLSFLFSKRFRRALPKW